MKLLLDYLPIAVFFVVFKWAEELIHALQPWLSDENFQLLLDTNHLVIATAVLIPATILQMLTVRFMYGKVETMHKITLVIVVLMGGLTVFLNNPAFVMWKPTIVNWLFALGFIGYRMFTGRPLLERMLSAELKLPEAVWTRLSLAWVFFFVVCGILNLIVAYNFSEDVWVDFKFFGMLGLTVVFIIAQGLYLSRFIKHETE
ncbi:MAG: septation protein A [Oceanospirillaceae bacterium]|nr:septation protein A [Oceanospirillaceae bacterium]|tara:strand:+ start:64040 stop:64645 length:606 start_codon:yes stop_codon:yes gene_type:complete